MQKGALAKTTGCLKRKVWNAFSRNSIIMENRHSEIIRNMKEPKAQREDVTAKSFQVPSWHDQQRSVGRFSGREYTLIKTCDRKGETR